MHKAIFSSQGAPPQGPYSPAITAQGAMVFVSGQGPVNPQTGKLECSTFREQAELTFNNMTALLEAAGTSWAHVVRVGVFLADLNNFAELNEIYRQYVQEPFPARTTVKVGLPAQMQIEVDCIALIPQD
ncbi:MAG: hypothetical protein JW934_03875 [Anaerolineae bacterium]|nr:hypothetical protein [Anaerolineae bacterium]